MPNAAPHFHRARTLQRGSAMGSARVYNNKKWSPMPRPSNNTPRANILKMLSKYTTGYTMNTPNKNNTRARVVNNNRAPKKNGLLKRLANQARLGRNKVMSVVKRGRNKVVGAYKWYKGVGQRQNLAAYRHSHGIAQRMY